MDENFKEIFGSKSKLSISQTLSKTPEKFFDDIERKDLLFLVGNTYEETRVNIYEYIYGPGYCGMCGKKIDRIMPGWKKGWYKTCSYECERNLASKRQQGDNNTSHRMTEETKSGMKRKMSMIMKNKISNGSFTPCITNYKSQRPIRCIIDGNEIFVRSLWELIYMLKHPEFEYEKIRIQYYDSVENKDRVYITDFFDANTNTIIEIRPKKYQHLLVDKKKAVLRDGYNYKIVDEDYFNKQKTPEMVSLVESVVVDKIGIQSRLKWLKKA